ncbi:MAG: homoserine kinase [Alphaproteobacteria bacterium]|nr:homoserine kinase [Alphaproteobacteria bacterium]
MAVYTEVPDDELARFIERYTIGTLVSCKGIAEGVENTNYILETSENRFILTLYEKRVDARDLPFFLGLLDHLTKRGIACPSPIHDRGGAALQTLAGRPAALFEFLKGISVRRPQPAHCGALGEALARLHLATSDFAPRRANALSLEGWRALYATCEARADTIQPGLSDLITGELTLLGMRWPSGLPEGVIHADLFPDNVLFLGPELSGLIDFYFACNDIIAYDVAVCLNAWCFEADGAFNVTKGRALLTRYQAVRPLSGTEIAALPVLARGAALRFLLTRLYDLLNHDPAAFVKPKDPLEYVSKLRFHQRVQSPADYGAAP